MAPRANIALQADGQRLTVVGTPTDHELIGNTLCQLDAAQQSAEKEQLQVYSMTTSQRQRLDALMGSIKTDMPGIRTVDTAVKGELMIWATASQHVMLKTLIDSLVHEVPEDQQAQLRTYTLQEGDLPSAQSLLAGMFPDAKIVLDTKSNHLLVWTRADDHTAISAVLKQIDLPPTQAGRPVLQLYDVPTLPGNELLDALQTVAPQAKLKLRADGRRLSVIATPDDQKLIAGAITQLQTVDTAADRSRLEIYTVTPDQRKRFDAVIESIQTDLPGIKVIRDARPGELAIWARDAQHKVLRELIDSLSLDVPADQQLEVAGYTMATTDPARVSEMLKELYPDAKILLDESSSRLLVWTTPAQQAQIKQAISQLDASPAGRRRRQRRQGADGLPSGKPQSCRHAAVAPKTRPPDDPDRRPTGTRNRGLGPAERPSNPLPDFGAVPRGRPFPTADLDALSHRAAGPKPADRPGPADRPDGQGGSRPRGAQRGGLGQCRGASGHLAGHRPDRLARTATAASRWWSTRWKTRGPPRPAACWRRWFPVRS